MGQWVLLQLQPFTGWRPWGPFNPSLDELATDSLLLGVLLMLSLLMIPVLEGSFGLLTRARLLELADQERPLLRRLSCEAPGTFEHTLMICGLAEEGARSIGADVDLIRTGSLYHDVGKLHAPEWFIENQKDGPNPHDALNDPEQSAAVLQAHVDEGLKLAKRHRLPRPHRRLHPRTSGDIEDGILPPQSAGTEPRCGGAPLPISRPRSTFKGDGDPDAGRWLRSRLALPPTRHVWNEKPATPSAGSLNPANGMANCAKAG